MLLFPINEKFSVASDSSSSDKSLELSSNTTSTEFEITVSTQLSISLVNTNDYVKYISVLDETHDLTENTPLLLAGADRLNPSNVLSVLIVSGISDIRLHKHIEHIYDISL